MKKLVVALTALFFVLGCGHHHNVGVNTTPSNTGGGSSGTSSSSDGATSNGTENNKGGNSGAKHSNPRDILKEHEDDLKKDAPYGVSPQDMGNAEVESDEGNANNTGNYDGLKDKIGIKDNVHEAVKPKNPFPHGVKPVIPKNQNKSKMPGGNLIPGGGMPRI